MLNIRSLEAGDRQTVWVFMGPNIRSGVALSLCNGSDVRAGVLHVR